MIKNKYELKEDRLFYKYERFKNKIILKKIPYEIELTFIFYNCHINNKIHLSLRKSKERLKNSDYYYEGITTDLTKYIKKCRKCSITENLKVIRAPMKQIIENGPHFRIEMDILYLPDDIEKVSGCNYILDIIDIFSKWLFSYPLITKSSKEVLITFRKFIESFGVCKNSKLIKNVMLTNYCIENKIERLYSPPYYPQANGAQKKLKK